MTNDINKIMEDIMADSIVMEKGLENIDFTRKELVEKRNENAKKILEKWNIRSRIIKDITYQIIDNVVTNLRLPEKGEQIRIRTQQQINLISLIVKILDENHKINELTIATYTLNREIWSILIDLIKAEHIKKINLLITSSYSFRDNKLYEWMKDTANQLKDNYNFHLIFAWLHLKITLARCNDNYYQFEGSMNYSTNNMVEQILFENNQVTYDHDYFFLTETILDRDNKALEIIC